MKNILKPILALSLIIFTNNKTAFSQAKKTLYNPIDKIVNIYTTADSTTLRLSKLQPVNFKEKGQPSEGEVTVFVDPDKSFQTFLELVLRLQMHLQKHFINYQKINNKNF